MRVTDRLTFESARSAAAQTRQAAQDAQQLVSRGTRIEHPGDDPAGAGLMVASQLSAARMASIASATAAAADELSSADTALGGISTALARARELAVQLSSDGYSASDRANGAREVAGLFDQIVSDLNTRVGDRYVFGGTADRAPPFQPDGTFVGNGAVRNVEVAPGVWQAASVRADVVMGVGGAGGGRDVLGVLDALEQALTAGDGSGIRASLDGLDAGIDQVASARSGAGTSMQLLDAASAAAKIASTDDQTRASKQGEVDLADAAIQMQATQNALQASLAAAAQSFRISLLDYLK